MKHKLIILALVFSLVFVSQDTFSLGMGKIQVNSALDEPLNASIDIIANDAEVIEQVSAKLASSDDYKKVGLDKSFVPANIMISVDENNPYQINVRSNGPVSEPIVSLLLDVTWANGRILREFTLLLDPPSYQNSTIGSVSVPVTEPVQQEPETLADVQDDAVTAQSDDIPPVSQDLNQAEEDLVKDVPAESDQDGSEFTVETPMEENISETLSVIPGEVYVDAGDTLWRIANQNKPGDVTTHQMMMAIYDKNPNAFLNNNINEMIKGSTLQMPDADSADYLSYQEALAEFESHNSRWTKVNDSYSSFQTESQVDEDQTVADTSDYGVQLSGGEGDDADSQQTEGDIAESGNAGLSDEDAFNTSSENEELKSRVSELESIVDEQQSALELQDDDMANLENQMAQEPTDEDALTEGDFDAVTEAGDETLADDTLADDVWDSDVTQDKSDETTDNVSTLADGELTEQDMTEEQGSDTADTFDETVPTEELIEDLAEEDDTNVTAPSLPPISVNEPWYTPVMNWIEQNILWVIIGLVVLFLIVLLPRLFNRGDEDPAEESSFLDDIKSTRDKQKAEAFNDDLDELDENEETVLTSPIAVDDDSLQAEDMDSFDPDDGENDEDEIEHDEDDDDEDDDVLATLDNSLAFDDSDEDDSDDEFEFDFDDDEEVSSESEKSSDTDLSYETPTKEYDPAPFKDDDSFEDNFDLSDLDDDMDDDLGDDEIVETASGEDDDLFGDEDLDLESELSELEDDELETTDMNVDEEQPDETDNEIVDFSDDDFLADLDTVEDDQVSEDEPDDNSFDDSDDDFDESLSLDEEDQATTFETEEDEAMDEDIDLGLDDLMDDGDVIETKLDLAKAYIEMGDTEGAKNLLDEVKAEGTEAQQSEANKLLDDM